MKKNCHTCKHLEYECGDEYGSGSGYFCGKRDPVSVKEESKLLANMDSEAYRNRYKRCFESSTSGKEGAGDE